MPATNRRHLVPGAHNPGATTRKAAKAQDSGARYEDQVISTLVNVHGVDSWRRPGIKSTRVNGKEYLPDAAGYMPELGDLVIERSPDVRDPRPDYNFLLEIKGQTKAGSADVKIDTAIRDLAHASDERGVPAALILRNTVATEQQFANWKAIGEIHLVVVLKSDELHLLADKLRSVASRRRALLGRIGPRGGYKPTAKPSRYERGLSERIAHRRAAGRTLYLYGSYARPQRRVAAPAAVAAAAS